MARVTEKLAELAGAMMLTPATVSEVSRLSPRFLSVELHSDTFRTANWTPGTLLQMRPVRTMLTFRAYTPVGWDTERGLTRLIVFTHGGEGPAGGPADAWFRGAAVDDICEVIGPRRSMRLPALAGPVLFVGDETTVGLACALRTVTTDVRHVFEATDPAELATVLTGLGVHDHPDDTPPVIGKTPDRAALLTAVRAAAAAYEGPFDLVVSGDAATVHAVRRDTRQWPTRPRTIQGKAYWAKGRKGLD
ncbi:MULTISPECIES: siderophore-interacting protein [unclassified Streptomyces]|uniref:siderophore-interacting protein n=1 Tax=unclassified Streptomyces TaxID=2593676 RepID=UPI0037F3305F